MLIPRFGQSFIENWLFKNKIIIVYGARQVGKTTLTKALVEKYSSTSTYFNCESLPVKEMLESYNLETIKSFFGNYKLIVLDEAQKIKNIGNILKLIIDTYPEIQIIATGSSSFELGNKVSEPLTGRNFKLTLYPISIQELSQVYDVVYIQEKLEHYLRFGMYPEVVEANEYDARERLELLAGDYLYRDILSFETLKKPELLIQLLKALALQVSREVTYRELAKLLDTSSETIQKYISLLEQSFIVFKLHSFSRKLRNELKSGFKVYFYDLGIRNSLISNFNTLENRTDKGALWENFCIIEKMKQMQVQREYGNLYFWRTYAPDKEIDLIIEKDGQLFIYEFKWNPKASGNARLPKNFFEAYTKGSGAQDTSKNVEFKVIDSQNWWQWLH